MHAGFWFYTIGQRQGLGLAGGPWYVVAKDTQSNSVYISRNYYSAEKKRNKFEVDQCNWLSGTESTKRDLQVKMRHGAQLYACTVKYTSDGRMHVALDERDQGIAPGQFAVFYDETECLGSGVIVDTNQKEYEKIPA